MLRAVLELLAPGRCLSCRAPASPPWCPACAVRADRLRARATCRRCGAGAPDGHGCWPAEVPVAGTVVAYDYRGPVADAVVAAKTRGGHAAWPALGARLAEAVTARNPPVDVVTWVPADPQRRRARGLDHAARLAAPVALAVRRPSRPLLVARGGRPDQTGRPLGERRRVPDAAFAPTAPLRGAAVLLVDDVLTSGGTARAAAAALQRGGAGPVWLAVLARAGTHPLAAGPTTSV